MSRLLATIVTHLMAVSTPPFVCAPGCAPMESRRDVDAPDPGMGRQSASKRALPSEEAKAPHSRAMPSPDLTPLTSRLQR